MLSLYLVPMIYSWKSIVNVNLDKVIIRVKMSRNSIFQDDKKLTRYRDGKIVSTKGERFSQVTKEESQEMKKSIVNIQLII